MSVWVDGEGKAHPVNEMHPLPDGTYEGFLRDGRPLLVQPLVTGTGRLMVSKPGELYFYDDAW